MPEQEGKEFARWMKTVVFEITDYAVHQVFTRAYFTQGLKLSQLLDVAISTKSAPHVLRF